MTTRYSASYKAFVLAITLITVLSTTPVSAAELAGAAPATVGSIVGSGSVQLRGLQISRQATLFAGDTVRSTTTGVANLSLADRHLVVLQPDSQVVVSDGVEAPQIVMAHGTVFLEASGVSPLRVGIEPYELTMSDAGFGVLTMPGSELIGLSTSKGTVRVENTVSKEVVVVNPGQELIFGRSLGLPSVVSLGEVASAGPVPVPAPLPAAGMPASPAPQAGSGMSNGAWAAIVAAVGGGAGLAAFFTARSGKVDESQLTAANSSLAAANAAAAASAADAAAASAAAAAANAAADAANAQVSGLNSQITTLNASLTTLGTQFDNLSASETDARNQLAGAQAALGLRISVLENQLSATEAKLTAEQLKNAVLASTSATSAADAAAVQVIADQIDVLETQAAVVATEINDVQNQIALQDPSLLLDGDALVLKTHAVNPDTDRNFTHPDGAGPITTELYRTLDSLQGRAADISVAIDSSVQDLIDEVASLEASGNYGDIEATLDTLAASTVTLKQDIGIIPDLPIATVFVAQVCFNPASPSEVGPEFCT